MFERSGLEITPNQKFRGESLFLSLGRISYRHWRRRVAKQSIEEAKQYERQAAAYTDAQRSARGKALLAAGQSYLNGQDIGSAARILEAAQADLEIYASAETWDGYNALSRLYPALEHVYGYGGELFKVVRDKAVELDAVIETRFGLQTTIQPDHSRITRAVSTMSPEVG